MKNLVLFLLLSIATVCQGQQVDTVLVYGQTKMRIIVAGDTVMMSIRQFDGIRNVFKSFEVSDSLNKDQIARLKEIIETSEEIEEKYKKMDEVREAQLNLYKREYNTLQEIAANQNQRLLDISDSIFRKNKSGMWQGIAIGAGVGAFLTSFVFILISK